MAEPPLALAPAKQNKVWKCAFAVVGIMSTLVVYGVLQVPIYRLLFAILLDLRSNYGDFILGFISRNVSKVPVDAIQIYRGWFWCKLSKNKKFQVIFLSFFFFFVFVIADFFFFFLHLTT